MNLEISLWFHFFKRLSMKLTGDVSDKILGKMNRKSVAEMTAESCRELGVPG